MWVKISANIKIEYLLLFIKLVFLHLTILFMLTKRLSANKTIIIAALCITKMSRQHIFAIVKNSYGGNNQTEKHSYRQFVLNSRTAKVVILGVMLYNGNAMQIKLNISEPYGTFVSLVRCVSRI